MDREIKRGERDRMGRETDIKRGGGCGKIEWGERERLERERKKKLRKITTKLDPLNTNNPPTDFR